MAKHLWESKGLLFVILVENRKVNFFKGSVHIEKQIVYTENHNTSGVHVLSPDDDG